MGGLGRFSPCPICCPPPTCTYFLDTFDRANSTNIGADWTEVSGDWEIQYNKLWCENADALAICGETQPDGDTELVVSVIPDEALFEEDDAVSIVFGYTDSSNYYKATLQCITYDAWRTWQLTLYKVSGGTPSQIGPTSGNVVGGGGILFKVCIGTSVVKAVVSRSLWGATLVTSTIEYSSAATKTGLEISYGSGNPKTFNDFRLSRHADVYEHCDQCVTCPECIQGRLPDAFDVTLSGIVNIEPPWYYYCSDLDGTYRLDLVQRLTGGYCFWRYVFPEDSPCDANYVDLFYYPETLLGKTDYWWVRLTYNNYNKTASFYKLFPSEPVDCREINDDFTAVGEVGACDFSNATCHVESIL